MSCAKKKSCNNGRNDPEQMTYLRYDIKIIKVSVWLNISYQYNTSNRCKYASLKVMFFTCLNQTLKNQAILLHHLGPHNHDVEVGPQTSAPTQETACSRGKGRPG